VVHGDERLAEAEGEGLGEGDTDEQSSGESRAFGDGDRVQIRIAYAGSLRGFAQHRKDGAKVLAAGQLGHNSAVVAVHELRGDNVGQHLATAANHGYRGLVTGGFDAEDEFAGHNDYRIGQARANGEAGQSAL